MKTKNKKIITIGFHRTATTTLSRIFAYNNLYSVTGGWGTEGRLRAISRCDTISDFGENHIPLEELLIIKRKYPDSIYLLNTRSLKHWISSRLRMYIYRIEKKQTASIQKTELFNPTSISLASAQAYIEQRESFYKACSEIFCPGKDNLIIFDIQADDFIPFVCDKLDLDPLPPNYDKRANNGKRMLTNKQRFDDPKISHIFRELENIYGEKKLNSILSMDAAVNQKLKMFPNNLKDL